jgi:secondary thiamine-phosphate synthase enzyme
MRQAFHEISLATRGRSFYEITGRVADWLAHLSAGDGLLTLHLQHTSASLLIQGNADLDVRADLDRFFSRLVRDGDPLFEHTAEGDDDMPAHVRTALTAVNLSLSVQAWRLALGTWQSTYVWEHRRHPHNRRVIALGLFRKNGK